MKRFIALVLTFTIFILLVGCQETQTSNTETSSIATNKTPTVMKAWSGEFSEEELKSAITEYQSNYTKIVLDHGSNASVSFETDFEVSSCSVSRLSRVDDTDIEVELHSYIDLFIKTNCDGRTVTIPINWWYVGDDSWVNDYFIWSYLVCVKDTNGNDHYYYFRVDYTAYAE
mgnify:CR=1 FL=1